MIDDPRILIATDANADAKLVKRLLREEFGNLSVSVEETRAVEDFESWRPEILILAFNSLEKAERYYLGLYRLGTLVHAHPHRTLILCNKEDLARVYGLCKQRYFDDYVLFWPLGHDAPRLRMAVHHAMRDLCAARDNGPTPREFAVQARRIAELEALLEASLSRGGERIAAADDSLRRAETDIGTALDGFSRSLSDGEYRHLVEIRDRAGLLREFDRLKADKIGERLESISAAIRPARDWLREFREEVAPHMEAAHDLGSLADRVHPMVLLVDDDDFQHTLVTRMLSDEPIQVVCARSGTEGLAALRAHRPDLVLMDFHLPDIDGVEATRRLKAVERFSDIPVVMITGNSERSVVTESLNAGAADFIVKPFDKDLLIAKINRLLA